MRLVSVSSDAVSGGDGSAMSSVSNGMSHEAAGGRAGRWLSVRRRCYGKIVWLR